MATVTERYRQLLRESQVRTLTPFECELLAELETGAGVEQSHPRPRRVARTVRWTVNRATFPLACAAALAWIAWTGHADWWVVAVPFAVRFLVDLAGFIAVSVVPLFTDS